MSKNFAPTNNLDWSNFNSSLVIEVTRPNGVFTCSGVAVNEDTVLTAAHCLEGIILKVRVFTDSCYNPKSSNNFDVKNFELHPDYDSASSNYRCDIAKIKLSEKLPEEINFMPIIKNDLKLSGQITRLGFGARADKNIRTMITPEFKTLRTMEKTLELNDTYSYSGDSGGPVFVQFQGQMFLVAIHSTLSFGPEGKHSFNPLLSSHKAWINEEVLEATEAMTA